MLLTSRKASSGSTVNLLIINSGHTDGGSKAQPMSQLLETLIVQFDYYDAFDINVLAKDHGNPF